MNLPAQPTASAATRLLPPMGRDLGLALAGGAVLALLVALGESAWLANWPPAARLVITLPRLLLGLAYVLYVPGYCLTAALFPAVADLDDIERLGLGLGLSVAWVPVLALILDRLPWGLRLWPILLGQILSILVFSGVALWRRRRLPAAEANAPTLGWRPRPWWRGLPRLERRIYLLCAGALLLAAFSAAWVFLVPADDEFMTEFYILGAAGLAEDYPRSAAPGEPLTVTVGIHNLERAAHSYYLQLWAVDVWEGRRMPLVAVGPFHLARDETVEQRVSWAMPWQGQDQQLEFQLFSDAQPETGNSAPYRLLRLWMNVEEE